MFRKLSLITVLLATPVVAQEKAFSLQAPEILVKTGFLKHLLPRFSLKTGVRITLSDDSTEAVFAVPKPRFSRAAIPFGTCLKPMDPTRTRLKNGFCRMLASVRSKLLRVMVRRCSAQK